MGTLDNPQGATVQRKIKFVDVTGMNPTTLENAYNNNYGQKGWRIVQVVVVGNKTFIVAEKEL